MIAFCPACRRASPELRCNHCGAARVAGRYRVERVLADTAHGRVYLAESEGGEQVALEETAFLRPPDVAAVAAFQRAGERLKQLQHPRIPRYLDAFTEGEGVGLRYYLAQAHVPGASLDSFLATHVLDEAKVRRIAEQALSVLVYLQSLSPPVIHGDLRPSNLILGPDDTLSLVDFDAGHARGGPLTYAPAEQLAGVIDRTTDVFAIAKTMAHLLTRVAPLPARRLEDTGATSPRLGRWLQKATDEMPSDRFASASDAYRALVALDRPRLRPWLIGGAAAAAMAVAALLIPSATIAPPPPAPLPEPPKVVEVPRPRVVRPAPPAPHPPEPPAPPPPSNACTDMGPEIPPGYATIDTVPYSDIYWDGKKLGETPLAKQKFPSGCIELVAQNGDGLAKKVRIKIEPNKVQRYRFELR